MWTTKIRRSAFSANDFFEPLPVRPSHHRMLGVRLAWPPTSRFAPDRCYGHLPHLRGSRRARGRGMNYRHGYHAGNFADVVKHVALVAILLHLKKKDTAFSVIDSHGGRGVYDLAGAEAVRTGEA